MIKKPSVQVAEPATTDECDKDDIEMLRYLLLSDVCRMTMMVMLREESRRACEPATAAPVSRLLRLPQALFPTSITVKPRQRSLIPRTMRLLYSQNDAQLSIH